MLKGIGLRSRAVRATARCLVAALLAVGGPAAEAATITWSTGSPAGGDFSTGSNWTGGTAPAGNDVATFGWNPAFNTGSPIAITFSQDVINQQLVIQNYGHQFDLGGHEYTLTSTGTTGSNASVIIGAPMTTGGTNGNATLAFTNGIITANAGILGLYAGTSGTLDVGAGAVWNGYDFLDIGLNGSGTMNIHDGGIVLTGNAALGGDLNTPLLKTPGSSGTVNVTGAGSTWYVLGSQLAVGQTGHGELNITDGGYVNAAYAGLPVDVYVGGSPGATGIINVSGAGSQLDVGAQLQVGSGGTGTVTVSNGAVINAFQSTIGVAQGSGTVTVTGAGSQMNVADNLQVGYTGAGTLDVKAGGTVNSGNVYIGNGTVPGTQGAVTVDGAGSSLISTGRISVGRQGEGSLIISNGGLVQSSDGRVGEFGGSTGTVQISGADSKWVVANDLQIGTNGAGSLQLSNGGSIVANQLVVGSNGTVSGNGFLVSDVRNSGTVVPGTQGLAVSGNYTQLASGTTQLDVNGTTAGTYGQLTVSGNGVFGGTILIDFLNAASYIAKGQIYNLILISGLQDFNGANIVISGLNPRNVTYSTIFTNGGLSVVIGDITPEPAVFTLTGLGLAALVFLRRRKAQ